MGEIFEVFGNRRGPGEFILGADVTGTHTCYLIYGVLEPGEGGRELRPGRGHEELILLMSGVLKVKGAFQGTLREGQAVHLRGDESWIVENGGDSRAVYVIAGGHSGEGHH